MKKNRIAAAAIAALASLWACSSGPANVLRDAGNALLDASDGMDGDAAAQDTVTMVLTGECGREDVSASFASFDVDGLVASEATVVRVALCDQQNPDRPSSTPPALHNAECQQGGSAFVDDGYVAVFCGTYGRAEVTVEF